MLLASEELQIKETQDYFFFSPTGVPPWTPTFLKGSHNKMDFWHRSFDLSKTLITEQ